MASTVIGFLVFSYISYTYGQNGVCNDDSFKVEGDSCLGAFIQIENPRVSWQLRPTLTGKPHRDTKPSGIS